MATSTECFYEGKAISIAEALRIKKKVTPELREALFSCIECGKPVRPHRSGGDTEEHFEHLRRNPKCSLSHIRRKGKEISKTDKGSGDDWSRAELRAAVDAYLEMQRKHRAGESFVKKRYYETLSRQFGRTAKSFEYRMQNISYVLSLMGREWLSGLKPARNVGDRVAGEIEALIGEFEGRKVPAVAAFEIRVREATKLPSSDPPKGNRAPKTSNAEVSQYQRDPAVKGWILHQAKGICEGCRKPAPFLRADGVPFLEVHHVHQLADGGSDTIDNAVALCPNCHRELHYGLDPERRIETLYATVSRLTRYVK